jgi:uncharacterized metal-binding protein
MRCERCGRRDCYQEGVDCFDLAEKSRERYADEKLLETTRVATALEARHYMRLCRVEEVIRFAEEMGYGHLGIAFCIGLEKEAGILAEVLKNHFRVTTACCKAGGIAKEELGLEKIDPGRTEAMCNPAGQALRLNEAGTDLNLIVGLCVGHDIIFSEESAAPVTTVVVKDRVLAHNPIGALTSGYWRRRLGYEEKKGGIRRRK